MNIGWNGEGKTQIWTGSCNRTAQTWCLLFSHHILYKQWKNYKLAKSTYKREISDFGNGLQTQGKDTVSSSPLRARPALGRDWNRSLKFFAEIKYNMLFIPSLIDSMGMRSWTCRQSGHLASGPSLAACWQSAWTVTILLWPLPQLERECGVVIGPDHFFPSFAFFFFFLAKETFTL